MVLLRNRATPALGRQQKRPQLTGNSAVKTPSPLSRKIEVVVEAEYFSDEAGNDSFIHAGYVAHGAAPL